MLHKSLLYTEYHRLTTISGAATLSFITGGQTSSFYQTIPCGDKNVTDPTFSPEVITFLIKEARESVEKYFRTYANITCTQAMNIHELIGFFSSCVAVNAIPVPIHGILVYEKLLRVVTFQSYIDRGDITLQGLETMAADTKVIIMALNPGDERKVEVVQHMIHRQVQKVEFTEILHEEFHRVIMEIASAGQDLSKLFGLLQVKRSQLAALSSFSAGFEDDGQLRLRQEYEDKMEILEYYGEALEFHTEAKDLDDFVAWLQLPAIEHADLNQILDIIRY